MTTQGIIFTAPGFWILEYQLVIVVINPYSLFKFKIFVLNTSLFTFYAALCSWYDYV